MHGFCGRGVGEEENGQSRICTECFGRDSAFNGASGGGAGSSGGSASRAAADADDAFSHALPGDVNPFVRSVIHNMDNCAATNKSQYGMGAEALLVLLGKLDVLQQWYQEQL